MKMILYHGGSHIIDMPEIREPERTLDFGRGILYHYFSGASRKSRSQSHWKEDVE